METEIARIAARGVRVVGPNCFGIHSPRAGITLLPGFDFSKKPGSLAFISQSGGVATDVGYEARSFGLGISKVVSFGNGCDLDATALLDYLADDPETETIAAYLEGVRDGRRFLDQLELDEAGRQLIDGYLAVLDHLETRIVEATRFLRAVMRRKRWARSAALLQTMPGIGVMVALTLLAELGDWRRFKSRAAVANYAGLVPVIRDSNTKHYAGGITHRGPSHLRAVLVQAAWVAIKRVPAYTELFERVATVGPPSVVAGYRLWNWTSRALSICFASGVKC